MSGEKQPHTPKEAVIDEVAKDLKISRRTLKRRHGRGTYEAGLDRELDIEEALSSIKREIERNESIGGEQVG
jgi:hypothetical protein